MQEFLEIRNLKRYQHYSKRSPPWIKLYRSILSDYEFTQLPDGLKWMAVGLILVASECGNRIPADTDWIAKRLSLKRKLDFRPLVRVGFLQPAARNTNLNCPSMLATAEESRDRDRGETPLPPVENSNPQPLSNGNQDPHTPVGGSDKHTIPTARATRIRRGQPTPEAKLYADRIAFWTAKGSKEPTVDAFQELYDQNTGEIKGKWKAEL